MSVTDKQVIAELTEDINAQLSYEQSQSQITKNISWFILVVGIVSTIFLGGDTAVFWLNDWSIRMSGYAVWNLTVILIVINSHLYAIRMERDRDETLGPDFRSFPVLYKIVRESQSLAPPGQASQKIVGEYIELSPKNRRGVIQVLNISYLVTMGILFGTWFAIGNLLILILS